MKKEIIEKANLLQSQIDLLKKEKKEYEGNGICYLQSMDHYGNKHSLMRLYALPFELIQAMGYDLESRLSSDFKIYLESICRMIDIRIEVLQKEIDSL